MQRIGIINGELVLSMVLYVQGRNFNELMGGIRGFALRKDDLQGGKGE